jgi:hypothetical protein
VSRLLLASNIEDGNGPDRILEGVTGLQMEMMETKLRVNNMAARMGINTRTTHVQTHISYQPSNKLRLQVSGRVCFWLAIGSPCLGVCTHCDPISQPASPSQRASGLACGLGVEARLPPPPQNAALGSEEPPPMPLLLPGQQPAPVTPPDGP